MPVQVTKCTIRFLFFFFFHLLVAVHIVMALRQSQKEPLNHPDRLCLNISSASQFVLNSSWLSKENRNKMYLLTHFPQVTGLLQDRPLLSALASASSMGFCLQQTLPSSFCSSKCTFSHSQAWAMSIPCCFQQFPHFCHPWD